MNRTQTYCRILTSTYGIRCVLLGIGAVVAPTLANCAQVFQDAGSLISARYAHNATALPNGKVLIAGGTKPAELYDPASDTFALATGELVTVARTVATPLQNGKVFFTGGNPSFNQTYDSVSNSWATATRGSVYRTGHAATVLSSGKVLVAGGFDKSSSSPNPFILATEIYDPATNSWSTTGSLNAVRSNPTATLLPNGKILVTGGGTPVINISDPYPSLDSAEVYDPDTGVWTATPKMAAPHMNHSATLLADGRVLVIGSRFTSTPGSPEVAEIYDPSTNAWTTAASPVFRRSLHSAILLPNNTVLVCGGDYKESNTEIYHPDTNTWTFGAALHFGRAEHQASFLSDGRILITGGRGSLPGLYSAQALKESEIFVSVPNEWVQAGPMAAARYDHSLTRLANGSILAAGGIGNLPPSTSPGAITTAELFNPISGTWEATGPMALGRSGHQAILLQNGKVLVVGNGAETYNPETGTWNQAGSLLASLTNCSATLLNNGKVLATGGWVDTTAQAGCYLYSPETNEWTATGNMRFARAHHSATLLPDGKVFVYGGSTDTQQFPLSNSEIYDPMTGLWSDGPDSQQSRSHHNALLLADGKLLFSGGQGVDAADQIPHIRELDFSNAYDPATATWTEPKVMKDSHLHGIAVSLSDGTLLAAGGKSLVNRLNENEGTNDVETYNDNTGLWNQAAPFILPRTRFAAAVLPDGRVMVTGGFGPAQNSNNNHFTPTTEIYDPHIPQITMEQPSGTPIVHAASRNFGNLLLGDANSLQFAIRNTGTAELTELSLALDGPDAASFKVSGSPPATSVAPGTEVDFTLQFTPVSTGAKTAVLHVSINDSNDDLFDITLTGNGYILVPEITVSQPSGGLKDGGTAKSFGSVKVGKSSAFRKFTIKNTGNADLTRLAISKDGKQRTDFIIGQLEKNTLSQGTSTTFTVTFKPTAKGSRNAVIHIRSNDADENPFDIKLTGTGVKP